jgi:hypothetical protein
MQTFIDLISSQGFITFISTFGLAVLMVLYFIFVRDPRRERYWQSKYDEAVTDRKSQHEQLVAKYEESASLLGEVQTELRELQTAANKIWTQQCNAIREENQGLIAQIRELTQTYKEFENDLKPGTRIISDDQAVALADLGLDRDLYKLMYYLREKLEGRRTDDLKFFINDSLLDTSRKWERFIAPFAKYPHIGELYPSYETGGYEIENKLNQLLEDQQSKEEAMQRIWSLLVNETVNMKRHFTKMISNADKEEEVFEYSSPLFDSSKRPQDAA